MIFVTLMLPVEVRILPTYKVVADLGLINTYAGLTLPLIASATATFLFRQFFMTVPRRAGRGGADRRRRTVALLLGRRAAAVADQHRRALRDHVHLRLEPVSVAAAGDDARSHVHDRDRHQAHDPGGDAATEWNLVMATALLAMLPPALVVVLMQKWFVKGLVDTRKVTRWPTSQLRDVRKSYGGIEVIHGIDVERRRRRIHRHRRPLGLRQVDAAADGRRARGDHRRARSSIGDRVVNALEPKDRDIAMVFQNYALYPHMSVFDNMAYGLKIRGLAKDDIEARVDRAAAILELGPLLERKPRAALGRPAPARRDGPRDRARARGVPVRRAAVEPRRQAARADALRDPEAAPAPGDDQPLRDARPGRGDDARAPDDRDERRPRRADRHADGGLREPGDAVRRRIHRLAVDEFPRRQVGGRRRIALDHGGGVRHASGAPRPGAR